jgi:hypothetical protein
MGDGSLSGDSRKSLSTRGFFRGWLFCLRSASESSHEYELQV